MHQLDNLSNLLHENIGELRQGRTDGGVSRTTDIDHLGHPLLLTLAVGGISVLLFKALYRNWSCSVPKLQISDSVRIFYKMCTTLHFSYYGTLRVYFLSIFTRWRVDDHLCSSIPRMHSSVGNWSSSYRELTEETNSTSLQFLRVWRERVLLKCAYLSWGHPKISQIIAG